MSKPITIEKIKHRGENRIKVLIPNELAFRQKIKSITGRRWSQTKKCWHIPYSNAAFAELKTIFGELNVVGATPPRAIAKAVFKEKETQNNSIAAPSYGRFQRDGEWQKMVVGQQIICDHLEADWFVLYVPYDKKGWIEVIKSISGRRWNMEEKHWKLPYVKASFRALKRHIGLQYIVFNFEIEADIPDEFIPPTLAETVIPYLEAYKK